MMVQLDGLFSIEGVKGGKKPWQKARATITGRNADGRWRQFAGSGLFAESGSLAHFSISKVIAVPQGFDELRVTMQLARSTGKLVIHDIALQVVEETSASI